MEDRPMCSDLGVRPLLIAGILLGLAAGCTDRRKDPNFPDVHPDSWMEPASPDFHGARVLDVGAEACYSCHGEDASGGTRASSCFECHDRAAECVTCHGGHDNDSGAPPRDLSGNTTPDAVGVGAHSVHVAGEGGFPGVPCGSCHVVPQTQGSPGHQDTPPPAEVEFDTDVTVIGFLPAWDRDAGTCSGVVCHGAGNTTPPWTEAHAFECTDCHGDPSRPLEPDVDPRPAPPTSLRGFSTPLLRGTGAHQSHVTEGALRVAIDCDECHRVPSSVEDAGHIEADADYRAEIVWGALADAEGKAGTEPSYIGGDNPRCADVYCHGGGFEVEDQGSLVEPTWTIVDGSQAACGTCHALPPHDAFGSCERCHGSVVDADTTITAAGRSLHINGSIDF
jgi:predicted CxxxxCH...CXXCH cytochrome family protein